VAVRFEHVLPDPELLESEVEIPDARWRNRGVIVVEGDFREVYLDAQLKLVIGECWKWRKLPDTP
jgi:hypothetical protein